ncbi:outer membrane beta-barrel family protein [Mucilaginibacter sp. L3T2-6]|uniref:outer membrane beta-barrel family protein n=1 Tax=Mucilaginibacter sp. L3T2-6 TaxID=3062491 RepID=UPI00267658DD|nr:outer membrane beta-barrel family protein [Mucilaginibacter sp. L3T2-6]MDO3644845.1 outer membrane beta-barrel family protein [Mucilaginibacter sp. L3T2-6]MDV6217261.1 outer membrane beta-barrel family protein [Mucilaginibacter sp. L3T2-6]
MKFIVGCFLSAFLAVLFTRVKAQGAFSSIQGKVLTETHTPADASTIILLKARDSSIVSSAVIGKNGKYRFVEVPPGNYLLLATFIGYYKAYSGPYMVDEDQNLKVPDIILISSTNELRGVTITTDKPGVDVKPGKVTLNIPNSLTADGASAFEILKQAPGVRVDNNGNINIVGRQEALITINGKTTSLTGDDLIGYLRSLQSNVIDKIELITSGSSKYDASTGGIVNIILKKGKNQGTNGTLMTMAGYGKYYKGSTGITFNDRMEKLNVFGSLNLSADKTFHNFVNDRIVDFNNDISNYHVGYMSVQKSHYSNFNLGTDFFISPNHTFGFLITGLSREDDYTRNNTLLINKHGSLDSMITASTTLPRHFNKTNYNLNYTGKLNKAGATLSADADYTTFNRSSAEYIINTFYNPDMSQYRDPLLLENLSPSKIRIWLSKLDFSAPLSKKSVLEAGLKYSHVSSNNDLVFAAKEGDEYVPDPMLSNHFLYSENINSGYINYQNKFGKLDLNAGLRAEQTVANGNSVTQGSKIDRNFFDLFPHLAITWSKDDKNEYTLSYNRGSTRPAYEEINPFLYYVDLYDYRSGNPYLKPEYAHNIELTHVFNKIITTTLYASLVSNSYEFGFYKQNDTTKVNILTHTNFGKINNYGLRFSAPAVIKAWWTADFHADISYQRYIAYPQNGNLNKGTQDVILNVLNTFKISPAVTATLSGDYESPTFYGITQNKARHRINAGIGTQLFNKRGTLRLNAEDIFNTDRDNTYTNYQNINLTVKDKKETRVARLTFIYRFGKTTVKAAKVHHTGDEEEQKRIGNGGGN